MEDIHSKAIKKLDDFINHDLPQYSRDRNYDFGITRRNNVSMLSKYISHRIINEYSVVKRSLDRYKFNKIEKYIQEVFWRIYWKGWLEHRPKVWNDYLSYSVKNVDNEVLEKAHSGTTNIECFNDWVKELKEFNYLHNHTRMWFASIWIFTLNLPWQLGAEFFMKHLYDGDAASNTLGWRWVAGIQTQGKHYLASEWNIKKFTNNRFNNINLNENAPPKVSEKIYKAVLKDFSNPVSLDEQNLIIFDNNLSFELTDFKDHKFKKIYLVNNNNDSRNITLSEKTVKFKTNLIQDQKRRLDEKSLDCEIIDIGNLKTIENSYFLYPCVGENLDFLTSQGINNIKFLYRNLDRSSWKYCNKGFFNFKKYIPTIIKEFF